MKIKATHERIKTLQKCLYCNNLLKSKEEKKRGTCIICDNKYFTKTKKLKEFGFNV
jgi:hypothetical protein